MQITDVKVFLVGEEKLRAFVSIVLDSCFMVNDIKVIQGREGLFISMPSRKKRNGQFKDVAHPLNQETRDWLEDQILEEYRRCLEAEEAAGEEGEPELTGAGGPPPAPAVASPSAMAAGPVPASPQGSEPAPAEAAAVDREDERSLDEIQRRHLSDSFWNVS